jgi:hypothetical protein
MWAVLDHLGLPRSSRRVRTRLDALEAAGSVERSRPRGITKWELTPAGRRRLAQARRAGSVPELPESPQHRKWREAHTLAGQEIERLHLSARDDVEAASDLLDGIAGLTSPGPSSDALFELGEHLALSFRRLGSASYCLNEWGEPGDAQADIDDHSDPSDKGLDDAERARRRDWRSGRRTVALTEAPEAGGQDA